MNVMKTPRVGLVSLCGIAVVGLLSACGGGGGGTVTPSKTTLTGSVFAAAVRNASVVIDDCKGSQISAFTTDTSGNYSISVPTATISQDFCLTSSGGTFDDEATIANRNAGRLSAYVQAGRLGSSRSVHLTPGTTIVHDLVVQHGRSLSEAENLMSSAFGYVPDLSVAPTNAINPDSVDTERLRAGLRAAVFSQLNKDLGLQASDQFALFEALATDLDDGTLDGKNGTNPVSVTGSATTVDLPLDISNHFSIAMVTFRDTAGLDNTGLGNDKIGELPFAKISLTNSYKVEYIPGMMKAMEGRTEFKLRVTDIDTDTPVSGLNIRLMPMMYMSSMMHGTPVADVIDNGDGTYTGRVYYLMASRMMNGMSMGFWQLKVMIGDMMAGETAVFFPDVMMSMDSGNSVKAVLKGQTDSDMITGMMGMKENRSYYLFRDGLYPVKGGGYTLTLYVAARENMMSYARVFDGAVLSATTDDELTITSISLEASLDGASWFPAVYEVTTGTWSVELGGLTVDITSNVSLRLTVNGEVKTVNGMAGGDDAVLIVTPAAAMPTT